eukprot:UN09248
MSMCIIVHNHTDHIVMKNITPYSYGGND